jgi:hypothetical protein
MAHAARQRRWRARRQLIDVDAKQAAKVGGANIVTHQGSLGRPDDASLVAWINDQAEASVIANSHQGATTAVEQGGGPRCRRCGAILTLWVRQGFLRRSAGARAAPHDHSP